MAAVVSPVAPEFGEGVYSFPAAARLVRGASARQLRYWIRSGLTPVTHSRQAQSKGSDVLSFHDVISLEIVRRIRDAGVSLQKVRTLEAQMRNVHPDVPRPFALQRFWTDGVDVWYELEPGDQKLLQATGRDRDNFAWRDGVASFAEEIEYEDGVASLWHPQEWINIDPRIHFGEPVITGTRVAVATIVNNLRAASTEDVAGWYGLSVEQVAAAAQYAAQQ